MSKTTQTFRNGRETEKVTIYRFDTPVAHGEHIALGVINNVRRYDGEVTYKGYWLMVSEKSTVAINKAEFQALTAA